MDVVETKQSRLGSKSCNPYWLARNQTLLVISLSYWQWGNSPAWCYPQGEWRGTALQDIQGAFVLRCHLLDLSCRAVLGFRGSELQCCHTCMPTPSPRRLLPAQQGHGGAGSYSCEHLSSQGHPPVPATTAHVLCLHEAYARQAAKRC